MQINQQAATGRLQSTPARRRWFAVRGRFRRSPAPVFSSEAEVLRALGEDRPSSRGSPSRPPELPLQRPWF
jgi:hypothetical protein